MLSDENEPRSRLSFIDLHPGTERTRTKFLKVLVDDAKLLQPSSTH